MLLFFEVFSFENMFLSLKGHTILGINSLGIASFSSMGPNYRMIKTSRERHNIEGSKIAKGLQSVKCSLSQYSKNPKVASNWRAKRGTLSDFLRSSLFQNIRKGDPLGRFFRKTSHNIEKKRKGVFSLARYFMLREKRQTFF